MVAATHAHGAVLLPHINEGVHDSVGSLARGKREGRLRIQNGELGEQELRVECALRLAVKRVDEVHVKRSAGENGSVVALRSRLHDQPMLYPVRQAAS